MFQITANLSELDTEQRESLAAFILSFPRNNNFYEVSDNEKPVIIPTFSVHSEEDNDDEQSPETAFSVVPTPATTLTIVPAVHPTSAVASTVIVAAALPALPTDGVAALDKNGIPWDERIHASSRVKIADGSWRTKRGVDEALVAQVTTELKALMGLPTPPPVASVIPPPPAPIADTPAAVVAAVPAPPVIADKAAFVALIGKASSLIQANKLTQEELVSAVNLAGVPSLPMLGNRLDLVPLVVATIDAMVAGR